MSSASTRVPVSDCARPWSTRSQTYGDYVTALCQRNPSLTTLSEFLRRPDPRMNGCQIASLDFRKGTFKPIIRHVPDIDCLFGELHGKAEADASRLAEETRGHPLLGRILVFEDLTVGAIEVLGSELDIDPFFFAMHLHTLHRTASKHQIPDEAALPSRNRTKDYMNISYQRPVICDTFGDSGGKWVRDTAVDRKLVLLRSTTIALAAHVISVNVVRRRNGFWIGKFPAD